MAGDDRTGELVAYLSRLTGEALSADQRLQLRSVQRAALASWCRKQGLPVRFAVITSGAPFSVRELLAQEGGAGAQAAMPPPSMAGTPAGLASSAFRGIGIDIEEVASLPPAEDYREHSFYQDNFTPAELSYCIRQADVRASLCGIWAAKEAVVKSGLAPSPGRLSSIEITHDPVARPSYAGAYLSISHTPATAVAVCVAAATDIAVAPAPVPTPPHAALPPPGSDHASHRALVAACVAVAIFGVALSAGMHAWL